MSQSNDAPERRTRYGSNGAVDLDLIADDLARVEEKMEQLLTLARAAALRGRAPPHRGGGKRVRPAVALLVFKACGGRDVTDMIDVAIALELIHSATLLHDDIIDGGETRRGRPSAFQRYGLANTLVAGDFLFSKAFELCGRFEEQIVRWAADACVSLTEGEVMQGRFRRNPATTVDDYLEIIARKTASLFSQGARVAAHLAGRRRARHRGDGLCGFNIGMAFQIIDDILDVEGRRADRQAGRHRSCVTAIRRCPLVLAVAQDARGASRVRRRECDRGRDRGRAAARPPSGRARRPCGSSPRTTPSARASCSRSCRTSSYRQALDDIIAEVEERRL